MYLSMKKYISPGLKNVTLCTSKVLMLSLTGGTEGASEIKDVLENPNYEDENDW